MALSMSFTSRTCTFMNASFWAVRSPDRRLSMVVTGTNTERFIHSRALSFAELK